MPSSEKWISFKNITYSTLWALVKSWFILPRLRMPYEFWRHNKFALVDFWDVHCENNSVTSKFRFAFAGSINMALGSKLGLVFVNVIVMLIYRQNHQTRFNQKEKLPKLLGNFLSRSWYPFTFSKVQWVPTASLAAACSNGHHGNLNFQLPICECWRFNFVDIVLMILFIWGISDKIRSQDAN